MSGNVTIRYWCPATYGRHRIEVPAELADTVTRELESYGDSVISVSEEDR